MFAFRQAVTGYVPVASQRGRTSGKLVKQNILSFGCQAFLALCTVLSSCVCVVCLCVCCVFVCVCVCVFVCDKL